MRKALKPEAVVALYKTSSVWEVSLALKTNPYNVSKILREAGVTFRKNGPRLKSCDIRLLCNRYREGKGLVELSREFNLSASTVLKRLAAAGEPIRQRGRPTGPLWPRTFSLRELEIQALRKKGIPMREIGARYGVTRQAISQTLAKLNAK